MVDTTCNTPGMLRNCIVQSQSHITLVQSNVQENVIICKHCMYGVKLPIKINACLGQIILAFCVQNNMSWLDREGHLVVLPPLNGLSFQTKLGTFVRKVLRFAYAKLLIRIARDGTISRIMYAY